MDKKLIEKLKLTFDDIAHKTDDGLEYWYARELQVVLAYKEWRNFSNVVEKAKLACKNSNIEIIDHFVTVNKTIPMPKSAHKTIDDIILTRYACYLIAQNGDSTKTEISFAQSYFAVQTRKQEILEDRIALAERMAARDKLKESEKRLSKNIYERGVDDRGFARIRSKGDTALFGGNSTLEMKRQFGIKENRPIADFLPTLTIAAKNLANEMTNYNVEEKDLKGEQRITEEHVQNNKSVRQMLGERGIKPEELPPSEDIKKLERRVKTEEKKLAKTSRNSDFFNY